MPVVNLAFSGGLESTYLLQKALTEGFDVNVCVLNVGCSTSKRFGELITIRKIIEHLESIEFKGTIKHVYYLPTPHWFPRGANGTLVNYVTQQFAVILGMMDIRRVHVDKYYPSVWIGWLKEDASETSFNEFDFSEEDYETLLNLPKVIGPLSNSDRIGCKYRAPLWNWTKRKVYDCLRDDLKSLIIPNGVSLVNYRNKTVTHTPYEHKKEEYEKIGIPVKPVTYNLSEAGFIEKLLGEGLEPEDFGFPPTSRVDENNYLKFSHVRRLISIMATAFINGNGIIDKKSEQSIKNKFINNLKSVIDCSVKIDVKDTLLE